MCLEMIPKWKEKEEWIKKQSFDDALEELGVVEQFFEEIEDEENEEFIEEDSNMKKKEVSRV